MNSNTRYNVPGTPNHLTPESPDSPDQLKSPESTDSPESSDSFNSNIFHEILLDFSIF